MKKICKSLLLTLLAVALMFNTFGIVLANTTTASIAVREEALEGGVSKLVFKATTPAGADGVSMMNIVFSYDESKVQLIDSYDATTEITSADLDYAFATIDQGRVELTPSVLSASANGRTAVAVSVSAPAAKFFDATAGTDVLEFYYKLKDGKEADSETFTLEKDLTDGSFIAGFYPTVSNRIPAYIDTITVSGGVSTPSEQYKYIGNGASADTLAMPTFTYTGSDKKVFKEVTFEIEGNSTTIAAPTKHPAEAAKRIKITATAWATDGSEMEGYLDEFGWSTITEGDNIALDDYARVDLVENNQALPKNQAILVIKPGCPAGTVTVQGTNGSCEKKQSFTITRDVLKTGAAAIEAKADGVVIEENAITVAKPAVSGSKSVVFTGKVFGGYGDEISTDVAFNVSAADLDTGITFENNTLTVTNEAPDCNINVVATYGELEETISVDIVGLEVDWTPVENAVAGEIVYGMTNAQIIPISGTAGTASVDGTVVNGEFSVVDDTVTQNAGSATVVVQFTSTETEGAYVNAIVTKAYPITIAKADQVIGVRDAVVTYDGTPKAVTAELERGDGELTYTYAGAGQGTIYEESATPPTDAGTYIVEIIAAETTNYIARRETVHLLIEKATTAITVVDVQSATYDGTAKAITATITEGADNVLAYSYLKEGATAATTEAPTDAGTYTVTISAEATNNWAAPEDKVVTLTINKATVTDYVVSETDLTKAEFDVTMTALEASTNGVTSTEYLADYTLPGFVYAAFEGGVEYVEDVTWTTDDEWNAKEGTYKFTAVFPDNENLELKPLEATVEVTKVVGTITSEPAIANKTVAKARITELDEYATFADIDLPIRINVSYPTETDPMNVGLDIVWNKTVADLIAAADTVTDGNDATVELAIADATFTPEGQADFSWITIESGDKMTLTITNKTPATVTVVQEGKEYDGETIAEPETDWTPSDSIGDENATIEVTYVGTNGTEYGPSTEKPVNAGTYEAVAKLNSAIYSGTSEAVAFTITAKPIEVTVDDAEKEYSDELPTFALVEPVDGLVGEDVLGAVITTTATKDSDVGEYDIVVESWTNKNYAVTANKGTLTITKKALTDVPVITGTAAVGSELTATVDIADEELAFQWFVAGEPVADATAKTYTPAIKDSNKEITVAITAIKNYDGTQTSAPVTVAKYAITGSIAIEFITDNGEEGPDGIFNSTDVLGVDTTGINNYEELVGAGLVLDYIWKIDGEQVATGTTYTVPEGRIGDLTVEVKTATEGDFVGSIESATAEIGKTLISGAITLNESAGFVTISANTVSGTEGVDYELVWKLGEENVTNVVTENGYEIKAGDYGKTITVTVKLKEDGAYTGEIAPATEVIDPIAPTATISTSATSTTITVTVNAVENGAAISGYTIVIKDGETTVETYTGAENSYTFEGLTTGTTYTIEATATNAAGTSATATTTAMAAAAQSSSGLRPSYRPTTTPDSGNEGEGTGEGEGTTTPDADVEVKVEDTSAEIGSNIIKDNDAVAVTTKTESGTEVKTTVNVADANVAKLEVSTKDSDKAAAGAAAEGAVGTPVEVKVEAKDSKGDAANVTVDVAIPSEEKAYAYIIDENGVATRTESVYNEETGEVEVANVPDGAVVMLSTTAPATFDDAAEHWAEDTINYAADAGIMNGVGGSSFDPDGNATRGMVNAMMVRLAKVAGVELAEATDDHKVDTDAAHWAAATDLIALANGWSTGVRTLEDGTVVMDTDASVTREQLVTLLWRFVEHPEAEGDITTFDDHHETSDWAKEAKAWAVGAGIINGKPGNVLDPDGTATRAEIATMFQRLMKYMTK